jgi:2-polyprenyl-3-methyl-5-hydroxy-6-metoxy-1,4-benzoquinol methylase
MKKCSICNKKTAKVFRNNVKSVYSNKAYDVMECTNCRHFFTNPTFSQSDLDDIYIDKYSYDAHSLIYREKRMRARRYASEIAKLSGARSALEVGCMHGLLLTELQIQGLRVSGVELDPEAVKFCKERGLDVTHSSVENHLRKAGNKHDVIIMSHVIEHIADPIKQLTELRKRMSNNGKLVLITPNSHAKTRKLFGRYWGYWQVPVHINHFNIDSIKEMLEKSGFTLTDTKFYGGDSLFFLSTFANMLGSSNDTKKLSMPKKVLVKIATVILRPWYFVGSEDMVVVASKT